MKVLLIMVLVIAYIVLDLQDSGEKPRQINGFVD